MVEDYGQKYACRFLLSVDIPSQFRTRQTLIVVLVCVLHAHTAELCSATLSELREGPQVRLSSFEVH